MSMAMTMMNPQRESNEGGDCCVVSGAAGGVAADGDQVPVSRRVGVVRRAHLLEVTAGVPACRRRAQVQVRAVGRDLAALGRCRRRRAPAPPPRETHEARNRPTIV